MRKGIFFLVFVFVTISVEAQQDTSLPGRAKSVLNVTKLKQLDKVLDYTYPKVFTIVPRAQLQQMMKSMYDSDEFSTDLDSVIIDSIFPVLNINDGRYAIVRHFMLMKMKYKEPFKDKNEIDAMVFALEQQFGDGSVRFDKARNSMNISMRSYLLAIKDQLSPVWTFINFDLKNPAFVELVLGKEVFAKIKENY